MPFDPVTWILARNAGASGAADVIGGLSEGMTFKGTVPTPNDLPSTHNDGDMYIVTDMNPDAPGDQGGKAVWYGSKWNFFDQQPSNISDLANDAQYLSSKKNTSGKYIDNIHVDGAGSPSSDAHEYVITNLQFNRNVAASYVPKLGEPVFEKNGTSYRLKIGDGSTTYSNLPYIGADFTPDVDGRSVNIVGTNLQVYGFSSAATGTIPKKTASGLEWIKLEDAFKLTNGIATKVTETIASGVKTGKVDVLYDNQTVKVDNQNRLTVPIDNSTIRVTNGKLAAKGTVAGPGISVTTNTNNEYVVAGNYKAGANVNLEVKSDGIYINSTASGGVGVVQAGDGIKVTALGDKVTVSGDYQAGDYIHIDKNAEGKLEISVDQSAVTNTYRPIYVNGQKVLPEEASSGNLGFKSSADSPTGLTMTAQATATGKEVEMQIANTSILQAAEVGTPHKAMTMLSGRIVALHCGGADLSNQFH